jgi:hypothetical protein
LVEAGVVARLLLSKEETAVQASLYKEEVL